MQQAHYPHSLSAADFEPNPVFNVLLAYEDFETGKNAKHTFDFLSEHLGHECHFTNQMWKFDVLGIPKLREMAAMDASTADIIVISCHGGFELPLEVKSWIELWLAEKTNAIALVALIDSAFSQAFESHATRDYLADVAKRAGIEFFSQTEGLQRSTTLTQQAPSTAEMQMDARTFAALAGAVQREESFPRWGINE